MDAPFNLTVEAWRKIRRRVTSRAFQLTRSTPKAEDLVEAAIVEALDQNDSRWDPVVHGDLAAHLCDRVWSMYGNESTSYRVENASFSLDDAPETASIYDHNPLKLLLKAEEAARGARLREALDARVREKKDTLVEFLLAADGDPGDEGALDEDGDFVRPPNESWAMSRAVRAGYTEEEVYNARKRLKRYAIAVMQADLETHPP